jgi:hypothetical protein
MYLSEGIHLINSGGFVSDTHLKVLGHLNLNPTVSCIKQCLETVRHTAVTTEERLKSTKINETYKRHMSAGASGFAHPNPKPA